MGILKSFFGSGIKVTAGFDLGAKSPLDTRTVVNTIEERDAHVTGNRAYEGLKVYVISEKKEYVYTGTDWKDIADSEQINKINEALNSKAEKNHKHSTSDITGLDTALNNKALKDHTHNYAASTTPGGVATEAAKVSHPIAFNTYKNKTDSKPTSVQFDGSVENQTVEAAAKIHTHDVSEINELETALSGKSNTGHTHNYAGSTTPGGGAMKLLNKIIFKLYNKSSDAAPTTVEFDGSLESNTVEAAAKVHSHSTSEVDGLTTALNSKLDKKQAPNKFLSTDESGNVIASDPFNNLDLTVRDETVFYSTEYRSAGSFIVDKSLSKPNQAADALETGNRISTLSANVSKDMSSLEGRVNSKIASDISTSETKTNQKIATDIGNAVSASETKTNKKITTDISTAISSEVTRVDKKITDDIASAVSTTNQKISTDISKAISSEVTRVDSKISTDITASETKTNKKIAADITASETKTNKKITDDITTSETKTNQAISKKLDKAGWGTNTYIGTDQSGNIIAKALPTTVNVAVEGESLVINTNK